MDKIIFDRQAKLYFASDFHLGAPNKNASNAREARIIKWLDEYKAEADAFFLVGDVFDFWFEYGQVVPKGFVRFLGKVAEITDAGIPVYFFHGNHDMWMKDYLTSEVGATVIQDTQILEVGKHLILVGHGDGLGPGDRVYKLLKRIFRNPLAKWAFRWLHPDIGVRIASGWSSKSRINNIKKGGEEFQNEHEWLYQYALETEKTQHFDFYIFGHRHLPLEMKVSDNSNYVNLGEWVNYQTYAVYEGERLELKTYEE